MIIIIIIIFLFLVKVYYSKFVSKSMASVENPVEEAFIRAVVVLVITNSFGFFFQGGAGRCARCDQFSGEFALLVRVSRHSAGVYCLLSRLGGRGWRRGARGFDGRLDCLYHGLHRVRRHEGRAQLVRWLLRNRHRKRLLLRLFWLQGSLLLLLNLLFDYRRLISWALFAFRLALALVRLGNYFARFDITQSLFLRRRLLSLKDLCGSHARLFVFLATISRSCLGFRLLVSLGLLGRRRVVWCPVQGRFKKCCR